MNPTLDELTRRFREGDRVQAIADCESWCLRNPGDRQARRLCAKMHALTGGYARALELFRALRDPQREDAEILFNIGLCEKELAQFSGAAETFGAYTTKFANDAGGWANLAECRLELGDFEAGQDSALRAIALDATFARELAESRAARGDALRNEGRAADAVAQYRAALALAPGHAPALKNATLCLLELDRAQEGIALCREVMKADPGNLTARLGAEWLLSQIVPLWHVPMMNEHERNEAFHQGLRSAAPGKTVFEIGTGSGLLAMMAARAGATQVVTCEAVPLVAETAARIVARNGYADRVTVLSKPSQAVQVGADLPARADVLVHEVFSSELLGEHVLAAIEDAKARLLKPGGRVLPCAASIMIALVGGDDIARNVHVGESFGFDLSDFNPIRPRKRPLQREDLSPVLLSADVEAFRFDFMDRANFPAERRRIEMAATRPGLCYGLIQWIRIEMGEGVSFENHPARPRAVSNWQHTIYSFEQPIDLRAGTVLPVDAWHDRSKPWFELSPTASYTHA